MKFMSIKSPLEPSLIESFTGMCRGNAKRSILTYNNGPAEKVLDRYCMENYHMLLKKLCLIILKDCEFLIGSNNEVIVNIQHKNLLDAAKIITFGNGKMQGSKILQHAFRYRWKEIINGV